MFCITPLAAPKKRKSASDSSSAAGKERKKKHSAAAQVQDEAEAPIDITEAVEPAVEKKKRKSGKGVAAQ